MHLSSVNGFWFYLRKLFSMLQTNFVDDTRKTAHTIVVTKKYIIMICNKYIYDFWKTVASFALSAVQLHIRMLIMVICQRCSQLEKNKEIILHLTKKKRNIFKKIARSCWVKQGRTSAYLLCFKIWHFPIITGLHHPSKLNLFQEIRLTLLFTLEALFIKCV